MLVKPDLSPDFCVHAVVSATPKPSKYKEGSSATTTLGELGVVDDVQAAHFINRLKSIIYPWQIDDHNIASSASNTVDDAASSVENYAQ